MKTSEAKAALSAGLTLELRFIMGTAGAGRGDFSWGHLRVHALRPPGLEYRIGLSGLLPISPESECEALVAGIGAERVWVACHSHDLVVRQP